VKLFDVRCPHCGASPGERCIGRVTHIIRSDRLASARRKAARARKKAKVR